jgi:hypothetical protein
MWMRSLKVRSLFPGVMVKALTWHVVFEIYVVLLRKDEADVVGSISI